MGQVYEIPTSQSVVVQDGSRSNEISPAYEYQRQYFTNQQSNPNSAPSLVASDKTYAKTEARADDKSLDNAAKAEAEKAKKKQEDLKKQVATAHKGVYFNNDFSYVLDPAYKGYQLGDRFKRNKFLSEGMYDIGGEYRLRQHSENNIRGLGLTGVDDDFLLRRMRLYGNFEVNKNVRVFAEMIDAKSDFENNRPRAIEVNEYDVLNLFADAKLWSDGDRSITARAGRQELLLGDQRLISPLDWANTRRTFDGYRVTTKSKNLIMDGFYTHPVIVDEIRFDSPDFRQELMGLYWSYTGFEDETLDFYAIRYNNASGTDNFDYNTLGTRLNGSEGNQLYDIEVMFQGGTNTDGSAHEAASYTAGLGRKLHALSDWNPIWWCYFDWASGSDQRGASNGFHHLFPLAHKYNGFMDLFGRRNLGDANTFLTFKPSKKLTMLMWYHYFFLANGDDTPYNIAMRPFNAVNTPSSRDLGHELDLLGTYAISPRQSLVMGYSHFWAGKYYSLTAGVPSRDDADFLYSQWSIAY
jgi:hypothetical protein